MTVPTLGSRLLIVAAVVAVLVTGCGQRGDDDVAVTDTVAVTGEDAAESSDAEALEVTGAEDDGDGSESAGDEGSVEGDDSSTESASGESSGAVVDEAAAEILDVEATPTPALENNAELTSDGILVAAMILATGDIDKALEDGLVTEDEVDAAVVALESGSLDVYLTGLAGE